MRSATGSSRAWALLAGVVVLGNVEQGEAQSAFDIVRELDFECRRAVGMPPRDELRIRQLNPVIAHELPNQRAKLGPLEEVCVPVAKNNMIPSQPALSFIRSVDVACYRASAEPVKVDVDLKHLNPVLSQLPEEPVTLTKLAQVCLPVSKNNTVPDNPEVRRFINHFDLACYDLEEPTLPGDMPLWLSHLNPVIRGMGALAANHLVHLEEGRRLCVPIAKEQQGVPEDALARVRWADFLKYTIRPLMPIAPIPLLLRHLNPLFAGAAPFQVVLQGFNPQVPGPFPTLMVPVAKNGVLPAGAPQH